MKLILFTYFALLLETFIVQSEESGYYWTDYNGEIPDDAFPGGSDINDDPIYIGQSFAYNFLIPSKIYGSNKKVYYEYNSTEHEVTDQVKILCTRNPEKFKWILTDDDNIKVLTDAHLILGGYEPGMTTYIGRARVNGEVSVGKVLTDNNPYKAHLWTTSNGKPVKFAQFEVLSFNKYASIKTIERVPFDNC